MIPDDTGRFSLRPYYAEKELDSECERIVCKLLEARHGKVCFPIETDDLTVLIEQHDADLDPYADLSKYGPDVEGVTEFFPDRGPKVSISERLSNDVRRENRFRTTLTHEFGHVKFHGHLWAEKFASAGLFERGLDENKAISKRDGILNASKVDWMEWQAGYVSGAILMPATYVRHLVSDYCGPRGLHADVHHESEHAGELVRLVKECFAVSAEAARIRLLKLGLLTTRVGQRSLFH